MCMLRKRLLVPKRLKKLGASVVSMARKGLGCLGGISGRGRMDDYISPVYSSIVVAHREVDSFDEEEQKRPGDDVIEAYRTAGSHSITTQIVQPPHPSDPYFDACALFHVVITFVNKYGSFTRRLQPPDDFRLTMREFLTPESALRATTRIFHRCCPPDGQFSFWIIPRELMQQVAEMIYLVINRPAGFSRYHTSIVLQFNVDVIFEINPAPSMRPKEESIALDDLRPPESRSMQGSTDDLHAIDLLMLLIKTMRKRNMHESNHSPSTPLMRSKEEIMTGDDLHSPESKSIRESTNDLSAIDLLKLLIKSMRKRNMHKSNHSCSTPPMRPKEESMTGDSLHLPESESMIESTNDLPAIDLLTLLIKSMQKINMHKSNRSRPTPLMRSKEESMTCDDLQSHDSRGIRGSTGDLHAIDLLKLQITSMSKRNMQVANRSRSSVALRFGHPVKSLDFFLKVFYILVFSLSIFIFICCYLSFCIKIFTFLLLISSIFYGNHPFILLFFVLCLFRYLISFYLCFCRGRLI